MLILILIFIAVISITLVIVKKDENAFLLFGLCSSMVFMFSGIIIYTAKIGGLTRAQEVFLFLAPQIRNMIQYMLITLDKLGYLIAIGRYLFPTFFLMIAVNYSMIAFIRRHKYLVKLIFIPPAVSLFLYFPQVFYTVVRSRFEFQRILMVVTLAWIIIYIVLAGVLLFYEYISITMVYYVRKFRYIFISHVSLALLYGLYCVQDPIQVYQLYGAQYLWVSGLSYANPSLSMAGWVLLTASTVLFLILGFWNFASYTQIDFKADQEHIMLERKFDTASKGISVFVHSIKNQLLSTRVLNKKINQVLSEENPDLEQLKGYTDKLNEMNENMLLRMEELYKSVKSNSISLKPVHLKIITDMAVDRFHQKHPDVKVWVPNDVNASVLADKNHLSEAIYNLLANGHDAIIAAQKREAGKLELIIHNERLYTVIEIRDNGVGINKNSQKKIFDPFYTGKNTNFNWGMGLYYVHQIVKSHLGSLRLESTIGTGTSFYIMLPRYDNPRGKLKWESRFKWMKKSE